MDRPRSTHPPLAWSDFQLVLVIARQCSVARACGVLGLSHATLLRRLDQIESRLQARLFDRVRGRYSLTTAGHEIEEAARVMEPMADAAQTRARGQDTRPSGDVRLATSSIIATHLLPAVLAQFGSAFPDIRIELDTSRGPAELRRREVDVALRMTDTAPDWVVGRELAQLHFKVYARRFGLGKPTLRDRDELCRQRRWIVLNRDASDEKFDRWLAAHVDDGMAVLRVDNLTHAAALACAGLGMALLPTFVERSLPDLVPLSPALAELATPLWLMAHPDLGNTARVQVLMRAFGPAMANLLRDVAAD